MYRAASLTLSNSNSIRGVGEAVSEATTGDVVDSVVVARIEARAIVEYNSSSRIAYTRHNHSPSSG